MPEAGFKSKNIYTVPRIDEATESSQKTVRLRWIESVIGGRGIRYEGKNEF